MSAAASVAVAVMSAGRTTWGSEGMTWIVTGTRASWSTGHQRKTRRTHARRVVQIGGLWTSDAWRLRVDDVYTHFGRIVHNRDSDITLHGLKVDRIPTTIERGDHAVTALLGNVEHAATNA